MTTPGSPFGPLVHSVNWGSMASVQRSETMSCVSNMSLVVLRCAAMTSGPNVRLGTKLPSMTSNWMRSQPASSSILQSAPRDDRGVPQVHQGAVRDAADGLELQLGHDDGV